MLEGLKKRGFQLTMGVDGSGIFYLALLKAGGYYLGMFVAPSSLRQTLNDSV